LIINFWHGTYKEFAKWIFSAFLCFELFFAIRISLMAFVNPESTAFQRSEIRRIWADKAELKWQQSWVDYNNISISLKRAVIVSEDDSFSRHSGLNWTSIETAWKKNTIAKAKAERISKQTGIPISEISASTKIIGGSTITQQLSKNLFLSGERTFFRKLQEFYITFLLEAILSKKRILEIYLNNVEFGEGIFGVQAASQFYFQKNSSQLNELEAVRLAILLPRPKYFEKNMASQYLKERSQVILMRIDQAILPK